MKNTELFSFAEDIFKDCLETMKAKNHDYATTGSTHEDALKNFKLVEYLNIADMPSGILVRMCDKMARLSNTYRGVQKVNESCLDTGKDLINYTVILLAGLIDSQLQKGAVYDTSKPASNDSSESLKGQSVSTD